VGWRLERGAQREQARAESANDAAQAEAEHGKRSVFFHWYPLDLRLMGIVSVACGLPFGVIHMAFGVVAGLTAFFVVLARCERAGVEVSTEPVSVTIKGLVTTTTLLDPSRYQASWQPLRGADRHCIVLHELASGTSMTVRQLCDWNPQLPMGFDTRRKRAERINRSLRAVGMTLDPEGVTT
jgi:hypothetical protein